MYRQQNENKSRYIDLFASRYVLFYIVKYCRFILKHDEKVFVEIYFILLVVGLRAVYNYCNCLTKTQNNKRSKDSLRYIIV